jgi:hypothetical protein
MGKLSPNSIRSRKDLFALRTATIGPSWSEMNEDNPARSIRELADYLEECEMLNQPPDPERISQFEAK